ncbi:polysaccharide pyruvyl transferase family protein [Hymenobacter terrenus]|uniref:polysaccharide pyruvyl transferase family protein n=1 Tax=Hymenobacter terrenus TaxID=1629124 RepID=UPI000696D44E|nr:polysaccharide pyruvyl transferase family protein [Hymenobacter terrenus]
MLLFKRAYSFSHERAVDVQAPGKKTRHILLRSGWQTENIGDIGHTPAMLALIEKYLPGTAATFWPWYSHLPDEEVEMLKKRFPAVRIVQGTLSSDGKASTPELQAAIASADFFLHNSGPATIAWENAATFKKITGKPFGVFGVTYGLYGTPETATLSEAAFVYFRDSVSLKKAQDAGVRPPVVKFMPDAVFSIDVTNDEKALTFLKANALEEGNFLCCIPHHRYTPVWLHKAKNKPFDAVRHARNEEMKENDHKPLRDAIIEVVRKTNHKILICNEDETEQLPGKEWLYDKLPEDVKPKVVWLDRHWLTDEAISVYKRSAGLFGNEMHSPIMCIAHGIPAIVCRWEEQSSKGYMWQDIGLKEWLFNFDNADEIKRFVPAVLKMAVDTKAAKQKAEEAQKRTAMLHKEAMKEVEKASRPV